MRTRFIILLIVSVATGELMGVARHFVHGAKPHESPMEHSWHKLMEKQFCELIEKYFYSIL